MRLRNMNLAGVILLMLAFTIGMASATDTPAANATDTPVANATDTPIANATDTPVANATDTPVANATDDEAANGIFGPGHLLYRLQIAFENMDEVFTFNASEKLGKQVSHARHRINEYRFALKMNDAGAADDALAEYDAKMNDISNSMSKLSDKDTGFINAEAMILKHQLILENLSTLYPNNTGLQKAYNNSKNLETKFATKIGQKPDLNGAGENHGTPKAEKTGIPAENEKLGKGTKR